MNISEAIKKLTLKEQLNEKEFEDVIDEIIEGKATSTQIGAFLIAIRILGENYEQILGAVKSLRKNMLKNVANERKELGIRTIFNLLGPLLNPAPIKGQLMGVYDKNLIKIIGKVVSKMGVERALIVHGDDGLDEITLTTTTNVCEVNNGKIHEYIINPLKYGFSKCSLEDIQGGNAKENAKIILDILKGVKGPKRDIVILNSAAALYVAKIVDSLEEGVNKSKELIDSGIAYKKYLELRCV